MPRPSRDAMFMAIAQIVATRGTCPRKEVGAVMVRENRIVSIGYNGAPPGMAHCTDVGCGGGIEANMRSSVPMNEVDLVQLGRRPGKEMMFPNGCTRAIHAEMNAVAFAARQGARTDDAAMYSTCATCANCAALLVSSGIARFVYLEPYRLTAGIDLLTEAGVEVIQHGATG